MTSGYLFLKFAHVLIAIVALGTSAGLSIVLEFYGEHRTHGAFVLHVVERIVAYFVLPGYLLMLATGVWMVDLHWSFGAPWIRSAIGLWGIGFAILGAFLIMLRRHLRSPHAREPQSAAYRRAALMVRVLGGALGFIVVAILYLMVFKPEWGLMTSLLSSTASSGALG
jgi:uncharacterized membrane protein